MRTSKIGFDISIITRMIIAGLALGMLICDCGPALILLFDW